MSIRVMTAVWDGGTRYAEGTLLVLLALADWADDAGRCYPSVPQIAKKSRLTERQVYRVLKDLKADGVLAASSGSGRRTVYQINTEMLSANKTLNGEKARVKGHSTPDKMSGVLKPETPDIGDSKTPDIGSNPPLTPVSQTPDICDTPINRTVIEPPLQPSGKTVSKNHSPYPLTSERVKKPHVDGVTWGRFRDGLRRQLENAPLNHPNFSEVVKGEWDFNACFLDWWLIGLRPGEGPGPPMLLTEAENPAATREGLRKYRKRIEALARESFGAPVEILVMDERRTQ